MPKTLFAVPVTYRGKTTSLYFEAYGDMLTARGSILATGIDGLEVGEDSDIRTALVIPANEAASHVRLWVDSLGAAVGEEESTTPPRPTVRTEPKAAKAAKAKDTEPVREKSGMTVIEEILHMMLRPEGVTLDQIVERFGFKQRDSASARISVACSTFGYTPHRSKEGVYTATKGRADGKGTPPESVTAPKDVKKESEVHVLGRGRRVAEARAN